MSFADQMLDAKRQLEAKGWFAILPEGAESYTSNEKLTEQTAGWGTAEGAKMKVEENLIRKHYNEIKRSDAILVINYTKNSLKNYIGGNSFLEMGYAYILNKKIFVLNPLPKEQKIFYQELLAMEPIVLNGLLENISRYETAQAQNR